MDQLIELLNLAWDEHGCLGKLRQGEFDLSALEQLLAALNSVEILTQATQVNRQLVKLTWFIPLFISWQTERVSEKNGDTHQLESIINRFTDALFALLGVP